MNFQRLTWWLAQAALITSRHDKCPKCRAAVDGQYITDSKYGRCIIAKCRECAYTVYKYIQEGNGPIVYK